MSRWALFRKGSVDSGLHWRWISLMLMGQLVLLLPTLALAWQVWSHGRRFLAEITHGNDQREKAIISVAAFATMMAMYYLPLPQSRIPSAIEDLGVSSEL